MSELLTDEILARFRRMADPDARWAYWQDGEGPMFVYNTGRVWLRDATDPAHGKFESAVYVPIKRGRKVVGWKQIEGVSSLHHLRRDAKARAERLYEEWREHGTVEGKRVKS